MGRRPFLRVALLALALALAEGSLRADEDVAVPVPLQMELLAKVAAYDKNLPARARQGVRLLILTRADDPRSTRAAQQASRALEGKVIASQPAVVSQANFASGRDLAKRVKEEGFAIVYVAPGFTQAELSAIAGALDGVSVLSAGAVASFVKDGVVLSFDLVSGKPKLLVHLKRARAQSVELSSQVLKLMKVVE